MVAIYARQSIDRPDSVSIDAQIDQCRKFSAEDFEVYSDAGYSGKNMNRPEFERMLQDIKKQTVSAVISYRLDRISRNIIDFSNLLNLFEKYHVKYISATEQFDTSTPMGRAMIYIVMVFAQLERETIAARIQDNYHFRSARGLFMGGNTPFGYDSRRILSDGKKISILEPNSQAEVLHDIFNRFSSKESLISICHTLNEAGIKTAKGSPWSSLAVKRVLQNISPCCADEMLYDYLTTAGYTISNRREEFDGQHGMCLFFKNKNRNQATEVSQQIAVVGLHRPLISSEEFIRVQLLLNSSRPGLGKRAKKTYLAGLIHCRDCGYSFGVKYTSAGNREYAYYHCRGRESRGVCKNNLYIPADELERQILQMCQMHIETLNFEDRAVESHQIPINTAQIEQLNMQIQNLIDSIGKGNAVVDEVITQRITSLKNQIEIITDRPPPPQPTLETGRNSLDLMKTLLRDFENLDMVVKIDIIRSMIKSIQVNSRGEVAVEYLF